MYLQSREEKLVCQDRTDRTIHYNPFLPITNVSVKRMFTATKLYTNNVCSDGPSIAAAQHSQTVPAFVIVRLKFACFLNSARIIIVNIKLPGKTLITSKYQEYYHEYANPPPPPIHNSPQWARASSCRGFKSHSVTPQSVGLLWTSDQPVAETST
jgi:hypothetical protein